MSGLEILAPAGGIDSVKPAVRAGADAIYLGASSFSARSSAHNFDREQLLETVRYCHRNGVAVHLACNTLVHDDEIKSAMELLEYACSIGVDALIMQDEGLISLIRRAAPEMPVHGSTQMSVHTPAGVEHLYKLGLTRAVLSRELSRKEIEEIAKNSPIELEVFVHGALCMSVSGQCYFSAMLGSRSGNRGACAQPCRLPFCVKGGNGHDLSLKDLSIIGFLRELRDMGIASAKIEGRMKRPEYVAAAVAACRQSLDTGSVSPELYERLQAVFSRSGFTQGYYEGRLGPDMFGIRSRENVQAADTAVFGSIHELYKNERQHIPVDMRLEIKENTESVLTVSDRDGNTVTVKGAVPEKALKTPLDEERCMKSLSKTGGTPYYPAKTEIHISEGMTMPVSGLNSLRTQALDSISELREKIRPVPFSSVPVQCAGEVSSKRPGALRARFPDGEVTDDFLDCELIYVPCRLSDDKLNSLMDRGFAVAVEIPRAMFGAEKEIYAQLERAKALGINEVLANNVGAVEMARKLDMDIHGGFGLNLTNTEALKWAVSQGLMDAEVSFELTLGQISRLGDILPLGIISYGRLPLMLTRNCPLQNDGRGCKGCEKARTIRDRKGIDFPVSCASGTGTEILNSVPLSLADRGHEIRGIDFQVLRFSVENPVERGENFKRFTAKKSPDGTFTRGLYYRGVE